MVMGRYYAKLIRTPSFSSIASRSGSLKNRIINSIQISQVYINFRKKRDLEKFLDKELYPSVDSGVDLDTSADGCSHASKSKSNYESVANDDDNDLIIFPPTRCGGGTIIIDYAFSNFENWDWSNLYAIAMAGIEEGMAIWDLSTVRTLQTLELSKGDINSVAFGRNFILATGSGDKKVEICKWTKGEGFARLSFSPLKEHKYSVSCVDFSPYGTILATASVDGTTILWDANSGDKLASFIQPGNSSVRVCQFSSRSTLLLTAGDSGTLNVWDISTRSLKRTMQGHEEAIFAASFSPDESYVVSGCSAGLLNLWDVEETSKPLKTEENSHDLGVTSMAFAPAIVSGDGGAGKLCLMVTGGHDHLVKLWNVSLSGPKSNIRLLRVLQGHSESVMCVRISPTGGLIASTSGDKTIRLWELSGKCAKVIEGHDRYVTSCGFSSDGKLLASGSNDKRVIIWDLAGTISLESELNSAQGMDCNLLSGEMWPQYEKMCRSRMLQEENGVVLIRSYEVPKVDFNSCVLIGTAIVVAAASSAKHLFAFRVDVQEEVDIATVCSHKYAVNCVAYSPQANLIASASTDGTVNLFNTEEKEGGFYHPSGGALRVCKFSLDGTLLIAAGDDEKVSLWRMKTKSIIKQFEGHEAAIYGAAFTPDGNFVITGCASGFIKLWDCVDDGKTASIITEEAHELGVTSCDFSPIGLGGTHGQHRFLLATGGNDSLIKIWYLDIGPKRRTSLTTCHVLTDHGNANVMCVTFAPSGKLLASSAGDKTVRLWDVATGTCLHVVEGHNRYVTSCAFAPSGSIMATCSSDHSVKVWQLKGTLAYDVTSVEHMAVENLMSKWTCEDVINWLAEIGFGDLGSVFESHEISGEKLATMTDTTLRSELSIEDNAVRSKILTEIKWLKSLGVGTGKSRMSKSMTIAAPIEFFCPITHDIMIEPVTTCDGHTYERVAITEWFLTGKTTSPLTNMELESMTLTPNFELQNRISEFLAQRLNTE